MSVELFKAFVTGMTDYIVKHNSNYTLIETSLNYLIGAVTGQAVGVTTTPLKEIFDRQGIIGKDSYSFAPGTIADSPYNLVFAVGAYWSGSTAYFRSAIASTTIPLLSFSTGTLYVYINAAGYPVISDTPQVDTVWQFAWNSSTHLVSSIELYAGVSILFDGDDYANQLISIGRGKSFTSVAERLEEIEQLMSSTSAFFAEKPDLHDGLDFYFDAGKVRNDSVIWDTPAGHVTLADNDTCYIEVDPADGTVSTNVIGYTSERIALYKVVTVSGAIDEVIDDRTWALAGTGGGGGGHTQNTDIGTSRNTFILNYGTAGAPIDDCKLEVERGDVDNVSLKWNETEQKWQYTNDGMNYYNIGDVSIALGAQELTKFVSIDDPVEVWSELGRSVSTNWEPLVLSPYITALQGCSAVILRVFYWDDVPGISTNVQFRKAGMPVTPVWANSSWMDEYDPKTIIIGVDDLLTCEFFVNASGTGTSNLRIFLVGYFEKVVGVGTLDREYIAGAVVVPTASNTESNQTNFMNRGLVNYIKVAETGGLVTGTYDIEIFARDTFQDEDLLYKATGILPNPDFEDWLPWFSRDADSTSEFHVRITNNDLSNTGTYEITIRAEQFA
jgi:hypothetical protein